MSSKIWSKTTVITDKKILNIVRSPLCEGAHAGSFIGVQGKYTFKELKGLEEDNSGKGGYRGRGTGGEKALETVKVIGANLELPIASLLTIASTDSLTSCVTTAIQK